MFADSLTVAKTASFIVSDYHPYGTLLVRPMEQSTPNWVCVNSHVW